MKTLLIDIETAPAKAYIWDLRTRYVPLSQVAEDGYILCFAASWMGSGMVEFASRWDHGEKQMIEWAWELLDEADAVIHYNGKRYDIPRLNSEFLVRGLGPPTPSYQIDLYETVSRKFKVLSKSMNHMLRLLSLEEKVKHKGMELWTECMDGVAASQKEMETYNIRDVEALEDLYTHLLPWIDNHPNVALWMPATEDRKCTHCGSENLRFKGYKYTRVASYKQYLCKDCGSYSRSRFAEARREDVLR